MYVCIYIYICWWEICAQDLWPMRLPSLRFRSPRAEPTSSIQPIAEDWHENGGGTMAFPLPSMPIYYNPRTRPTLQSLSFGSTSCTSSSRYTQILSEPNSLIWSTPVVFASELNKAWGERKDRAQAKKAVQTTSKAPVKAESW